MTVRSLNKGLSIQICIVCVGTIVASLVHGYMGKCMFLRRTSVLVSRNSESVLVKTQKTKDMGNHLRHNPYGGTKSCARARCGSHRCRYSTPTFSSESAMGNGQETMYRGAQRIHLRTEKCHLLGMQAESVNTLACLGNSIDCGVMIIPPYRDEYFSSWPLFGNSLVYQVKGTVISKRVR